MTGRMVELAVSNGNKRVPETKEGDQGSGRHRQVTFRQESEENNWIVMSHAEDKTFSKIDMRIAFKCSIDFPPKFSVIETH